MEIMPNAPTPWVGLAALVAMFVLPYLPNWLFDGPRTVKHRPRRHIAARPGRCLTDALRDSALGLGDVDHPGDPEAVDAHAELVAPHLLFQGHGDVATV